MSDHLNYCNTIADLPDEISTDDLDDNCKTVYVITEEKRGDELLIELYRDRPFLYDKNNINFKDCSMKKNAWIEMSEIMIQTNCGDMYTPSYCQRRCISLREQYSREKRKGKTESKGESAAAKTTRFPFFSQLAFLDNVIKRRRSYANGTKSQPSIVDEDNNTYESQSVTRKSGDELLIELYRERPFLYDKSDISFKDCLMKQNAWIEISKIMTQTNCDDMYIPSYCQKRCLSLREQYSREKRKGKTASKSESVAATATRFPLFSQLAFLDNVIKRRRSYTNYTKSQPSIVNEDNNTYESQSVTNESSDEGNENVNKQHIHNNKIFNKKNALKIKKRKVNEIKKLEQTLVQMGHRILSYMENKVSTADDAFMEFIKIQFNSIPEKEKNIRRKMIMDVLTAPLPEK